MYFYSHDTLAGPAYLSACVLSNRINHQFANETAQKRYFYACVIASNQENIIITKRSHLDFSTGMMIRRKRRWLWNPKSQFKAKKLLHPLSNHELNRRVLRYKFKENLKKKRLDLDRTDGEEGIRLQNRTTLRADMQRGQSKLRNGQ